MPGGSGRICVQENLHSAERSYLLKGRRAFKKVKTYLMKGYEVTQRMAQRAVSYYGWFKNSNLHQFMEKYGIEELQKYCKRRLSYLSKRNRAKEALAC